MSNKKLTLEDLEELVKEVLQEVSIKVTDTVADIDKALFSPQSKAKGKYQKKQYQALAKLRPFNNTLDNKDFEAAYEMGDNDDLNKLARSIYGDMKAGVKKNTPSPPATKTTKKATKTTKKATKTTTPVATKTTKKATKEDPDTAILTKFPNITDANYGEAKTSLASLQKNPNKDKLKQKIKEYEEGKVNAISISDDRTLNNAKAVASGIITPDAKETLNQKIKEYVDALAAANQAKEDWNAATLEDQHNPAKWNDVVWDGKNNKQRSTEKVALEKSNWENTSANDPSKTNLDSWKSLEVKSLAQALAQDITQVQGDDYSTDYSPAIGKKAGLVKTKTVLEATISNLDNFVALASDSRDGSLGSPEAVRYYKQVKKAVEGGDIDNIKVKSYERLKSLYTVRKAQKLFEEKPFYKKFFIEGFPTVNSIGRNITRKISPNYYKKKDHMNALINLLEDPSQWAAAFSQSGGSTINPWGGVVSNYTPPGNTGKDTIGFTMNDWSELKKGLETLKRQYKYIFDKVKDKGVIITIGDFEERFKKQSGLDLKSLGDEARKGEITGMDIFATNDVFKQNFEKAGIEMNDEAEDAIKAAQGILFKKLNTPPGVGKDIANLKEVLKTQDIMNIDDLAALFKDFDPAKPDKPLKVGDTPITADQIIQQLTAGYEAVEKDKSLNQTPYIRPILASIRDLIAGVKYFKSGRQTRTKSGTEIGFSLGTAETSGTARTSQELQDIFSNVLTGDFTDDVAGFKGKFQQFSGFLNEVSRATKEEGFNFPGNLKTNFSRFVALELLNKNIFRIEEASAQGFLFEAFLAMFLGGTQTGADRGGSDFKVGDVNGSAKFISDREFGQSKENLKEDKELVYVIALTSAKKDLGVDVLRRTGERLSAIDIHIMTVRYNEGAGMEFTASDDDGKIIKGDEVDTQIKFKLKNDFLSSTYAATLDFSFMLNREFEDFSSNIMSKIQKDVDKAFNSMTALRNNISSWVLGDNVVAASQVGIQKDRLDDSITALDKELGYNRQEIAEKKSKKDLDNLIKEVILKRLLK